MIYWAKYLLNNAHLKNKLKLKNILENIMTDNRKKTANYSKTRDASKAESSSPKTMVRSEIGVKWPNFSERDGSALKSKDDLIS